MLEIDSAGVAADVVHESNAFTLANLPISFIFC